MTVGPDHTPTKHAFGRERPIRLIDGREHGRGLSDQTGIQPVDRFALCFGRELFNRGFGFGDSAHGGSAAPFGVDGKLAGAAVGR